jgi:hypothetical protein
MSFHKRSKIDSLGDSKKDMAECPWGLESCTKMEKAQPKSFQKKKKKKKLGSA